MVEKPDYVLNFVKPKLTEVKCISGHWYLYSKTSYYDKVSKKMKWKSGSIIGTITPNGLVPSKHRTSKKQPEESPQTGAGDNAGHPRVTAAAKDAPQACEPQPDAIAKADDDYAEAQVARMNGSYVRTLADVVISPQVEMGAVTYLLSRTAKVRICLQMAFPDCWKVIYTISMLRAIHGRGGRFCRIEGQYKRSYLSHLFPGLDLSKEALTGFLMALGMDRKGIECFMNQMREDSEQIALFDGHRIICSSTNIQIAKTGYDSKHRYKRQINVIYMFSASLDSIGLPSYYEQFTGSTNDMSGIEKIIQKGKALKKDVTVIADKGCTSALGMDMLENGDMYYVLAIKRGTYGTGEKIPLFHEYHGAFSYHSRGIKYYIMDNQDDNSRVIIYLDLHLLANEGSSRIVNSEISSGKVVHRLEKDLNKRQKELKKAECALKKAQKMLDTAGQRVTAATGNLEVSRYKRNEALSRLAEKSESVKAKRDRVKAAKNDVKREYAEGVLQRAEAAEAKAKSDLANAETDYCNRDQQLKTELDKRKEAAKMLAAAKADMKKCQEAVEAGEALLKRAKENFTGLTELSEDELIPNLDPQMQDPVTPEVGTFALKTNRLDLTAEEVYLLYKQRPAIEEYFKLYDDTLGFDSSYMQNVASEEAWLFFNHVSSIMAVLALQDIEKSGQSKSVSFNGLMELLLTIRATQRDDGSYDFSPIESNISDICTRLGYNPLVIPDIKL